MPTARVEFVMVTVPDVLSAPLPITVDPSRKKTLPVGVPPVPVTAAVRERAFPTIGAEGVDVKLTELDVVPAPFTSCSSVGEELTRFRASPEYVATIEYAPVVRLVE